MQKTKYKKPEVSKELKLFMIVFVKFQNLFVGTFLNIGFDVSIELLAFLSGNLMDNITGKN